MWKIGFKEAEAVAGPEFQMLWSKSQCSGSQACALSALGYTFLLPAPNRSKQSSFRINKKQKSWALKVLVVCSLFSLHAAFLRETAPNRLRPAVKPLLVSAAVTNSPMSPGPVAMKDCLWSRWLWGDVILPGTCVVFLHKSQWTKPLLFSQQRRRAPRWNWGSS